jgi:hypothetical protein
MTIGKINNYTAGKGQMIVTANSVATEKSLNTSATNFEAMLPFASEPFEISKNINDYYLTTVPILTSDLPNRNGVGMPLQELIKWNPELGRQAYQGWKGMPLHYEHKSDDPSQAIGIIADVALIPVKGLNGSRIYKLMALAAVDTTKRTKITSRIAAGELITWSMGCEVESYSCSFCGRPEGSCSHLDPNKAVEFYELDGVLVYRYVHAIKPIELSAVEDPAYPSAIGIHDWAMRYASEPIGLAGD